MPQAREHIDLLAPLLVAGLTVNALQLKKHVNSHGTPPLVFEMKSIGL
jgi:hypothetical protein